MAEAGCARPTGARVGKKEEQPTPTEEEKEVQVMQQAQVGKPAPDFQAPAYYQGEFTNIQLEDYLGNWLLLCFYPGDFTYV